MLVYQDNQKYPSRNVALNFCLDIIFLHLNYTHLRNILFFYNEMASF